jgi:hypothetical protein
MTNLDPLLERNHAFAGTGVHAELTPMPRLSLFVITCIDGRVDPARVLGLELGDALVLRNAGGRVTDEVIEEIAFVGHWQDRALRLRQGLSRAVHVAVDAQRIDRVDDRHTADERSDAARGALHPQPGGRVGDRRFGGRQPQIAQPGEQADELGGVTHLGLDRRRTLPSLDDRSLQVLLEAAVGCVACHGHAVPDRHALHPSTASIDASAAVSATPACCRVRRAVASYVRPRRCNRQPSTSLASSSMSSPSCQLPSAPRSYWRITPTGRKPTLT